jgi:RNA polymerase sigma-70 factor, ECF subfamily
MQKVTLADPPDGVVVEASARQSCEPSSAERGRLLRAWFDAHYDLIWRGLLRLGVPESEVDDAAQQVFLVAAARASTIRPGSERNFLFGTAIRIASDFRRARARERIADAGLDSAEDPRPAPDDLTHDKHMRELLDRVLDELELETRAVFVLFELEGMKLTEIAETLGVPKGTVTSRLRRGREQFRAASAKLQAELGPERGGGA